MLTVGIAHTSDVVEEVKDDIKIVKVKVKPPSKHRVLDRELVNLYQDVEGIEDDYLRCSICMFRSCGNTSQTLSKILIIGTGIMTGIIAVPGLLDPPTRIVIGSISAIFSISTIALLSFKKYSKKAIVDREKQLKHVLQMHGLAIREQ